MPNGRMGIPNSSRFHLTEASSWTHILLAVTVPVLAGVTIYLGYRDRRARHRRWAKWTFPIWLYVSVTGVVVYWLLYHAYVARS